MNFTFHEYSSREIMARKVSDFIALRLTDVTHVKGIARIAIPGGTTPGSMLTALGGLELDWEKVVITLTDERWVPVSSERSNQRMLAHSLFQGTAASATFVPLYSGSPEPALGLDAICNGLEHAALPLDIAVLGMGSDMHTASLFPGALGLERALSKESPAAVAIAIAGEAEQRITLSAAVLRNAERHLLIQGHEKRDALRRAGRICDPMLAPICAVLDGATIHYAD